MSKHTILVVDDEPNILSSLDRVLQAEDRKILLAKNAEEAWEIIQGNKDIEVIICDNRLPGMFGVDFFIKTKRLYPDTIRILNTGYPDLTDSIEVIDLGVDEILVKPITGNELLYVTEEAFRTRKE